MSELRKIGRILPTRKNAEAMLAFTGEDLARAKVPPAEIWRVADPENTPLVDAQQQRLKRHPERYLGAIAGRQGLGGTVEGFIKYNEWRIADQLPFENEEEAAKLEAVRAAGEHGLRGKPLGIFALHASSKQLEGSQLFIARTLVD
ncbi:MAG TPA: hypothetical protein VFH06_03720, partial [Candidatus Saccharimonadales bacterium]|nr:hypothetical protein [Candidatus Saccharimonadales bacterium]